MASKLLEKSINLLMKRQTNILSAAFVIMGTIIFSQLLGLVRQRLLVAIFGASNTLGVYLVSVKLPDLLFQLVFAGALFSAFIPVFSDYLGKGENKKAEEMASNLLSLGFIIFSFLSLILFIFAPFFLKLMNPGSGFSNVDMDLMANLMRVIIVGQLLFIVGTFFSAILQSYSHFFIPGIAAALYNLGIIIGIVSLSSFKQIGIFAPAYGMILGALLFILAQLPMIKRVGFSFRPNFSLDNLGARHVFHLMWPRTISIGIFQLGTIAIVALISFLTTPGRYYAIFDYAQTLAYAPVALFGQAIAQAAFPVLSRERERLDQFRVTLITSFNQLLYLVMPISILLLVLRIPVVRLVFGTGYFDWEATVLMGKVLALLSISIFSQALTYLLSRGFYALHDTKTPLIIGTATTIFMIALGALFILHYKMGMASIAVAYTIGSISNLLVSFFYLDRKVGGFQKAPLFLVIGKIFLATFFTAVALYIPIKLLDQLVFDTTKTINLLILTGISSIIGLGLYVFLTWLFAVKEASIFIRLFEKMGNWKEIMGRGEEVIDRTRLNP